MSLSQTVYGFAIGKRARFVLSIIKQKILIGLFCRRVFCWVASGTRTHDIQNHNLTL